MSTTPRAYGPHDEDAAPMFVQVLQRDPRRPGVWETVGVRIPERLRRQRAALNTLAWQRGRETHG